MIEIKWIRIATDMFNNRKIKQIRKMPDGDAVIVICLQILCLAGILNENGLMYFSKDIPFTDEMLATEFDRPISTIRLALATFEKFKMIEIVDDVLLVSNWEKYQSADKLEKIRQQNKLRQQRFKEKQKLQNNVTETLQITYSNETDIDIDKDKEVDKDKEIKKKPQKHKYGEYQNVLLSDEQLEKLQSEFPTDWKSRIERVSEYCASTGKTYKDFLATIRSWARKEQPNTKQYNTSNPFLQMIQDEMEKEGFANG